MADRNIRLRSSFCPSLSLAVFVINGIGVRFAIYDKPSGGMRWLHPEERRVSVRKNCDC